MKGEACEDDRVTGKCQAAPSSQRGLKRKSVSSDEPISGKRKALSVLSWSRPLGGSGLSVLKEKKKKNRKETKTLSSLGLQADLFGIYRIDGNSCQVLSTETQTDLNHMSSIRI